MIIPTLLSTPEKEIIKQIKRSAGVTKSKVAAWIVGKQVADDESRKISKACHELGFDEDVALIRKVIGL
jgi:hypothetical protein